MFDEGGFGGSDEELVAALDAAEWELRRVRARLASLTAEATRRELPAVDGLRSVRSWLAHRYRLSRADAGARVRDAALVETPGFAVAMGEGGLSGSQVEVLGRARANPRCGSELAEVAEVLVRDAQELSAAGFAAVVAEWERLADADGPEPDPEVTHARRAASWLQGADGTWVLRARFAAAQGAVVAEHLEAHLQTAFVEETERAGDNGQLERTGPQRRADVLADAVVRAADAHRGSGPEVVVNVVVDHDTFTEHLHRRLGSEAPQRDRPRQERVCRTAGGAELAPDDAVAAAIEGRVRRVVFDAAGVVIDLGRTQRLFTGSARQALGLADAGCVWAGCEAPTRWCHGDHVVPWARAGPTDQANGGLLCGRHNRMKNHGWSTRRAPDGTWHTIRPDGTTVKPAIPPFRTHWTGDAAA